MTQICILAPEINYLIKDFKLECYDIISYIQLIYIELIQTNYIMSKLELLVDILNNYKYYAFKINQSISETLNHKTSDPLYLSIVSQITLINTNPEFVKTTPEFIIRKAYDGNYLINFVSKLDNRGVSYTSRYLFESQFKLLMMDLIIIIDLHNYKMTNDYFFRTDTNQ